MSPEKASQWSCWTCAFTSVPRSPFQLQVGVGAWHLSYGPVMSWSLCLWVKEKGKHGVTHTPAGTENKIPGSKPPVEHSHTPVLTGCFIYPKSLVLCTTTEKLSCTLLWKKRDWENPGNNGTATAAPGYLSRLGFSLYSLYPKQNDSPHNLLFSFFLSLVCTSIERNIQMCTFSPVSSTSTAVIWSICTSRLLAVTQTLAELPVCHHAVDSLAGCSFSLIQLSYRQATVGIHQSRWKSSESVRATSPLGGVFFISLRALSFTVVVLLSFFFFSVSASEVCANLPSCGRLQ